MSFETLTDEDHHKKVTITRMGGGLVSFGSGHTLAEAIESALWSQNLDWHSVKEKVLDHDCQDLMHL